MTLKRQRVCDCLIFADVIGGSGVFWHGFQVIIRGNWDQDGCLNLGGLVDPDLLPSRRMIDLN